MCANTTQRIQLCGSKNKKGITYDEIEKCWEERIKERWSNTPIESLKFARDCAFYGIKAGCKREKIEMPYKTSEDLGDDIDSFEDLNFAVEAFTKAVGDFFQVKSQG